MVCFKLRNLLHLGAFWNCLQVTEVDWELLDDFRLRKNSLTGARIKVSVDWFESLNE